MYLRRYTSERKEMTKKCMPRQGEILQHMMRTLCLLDHRSLEFLERGLVEAALRCAVLAVMAVLPEILQPRFGLREFLQAHPHERQAIPAKSASPYLQFLVHSLQHSCFSTAIASHCCSLCNPDVGMKPLRGCVQRVTRLRQAGPI